MFEQQACKFLQARWYGTTRRDKKNDLTPAGFWGFADRYQWLQLLQP